jgi:hypothetical protein
MRWLFLLLAAGTVGLAGFFHLQPPKPAASRHMDPWMARLDGNADGLLSRVEYVEVSDGLISFDLLDQDNSGTINTAELEMFMRTVDPMWTFAEPD